MSFPTLKEISQGRKIRELEQENAELKEKLDEFILPPKIKFAGTDYDEEGES